MDLIDLQLNSDKNEKQVMKLDLQDNLLNVQDPSKLRCYMKCPRMYFFQYVLHLRLDSINHNLIFGTAFHKAKDVLFTEGYSMENIAKAYKAFLDEYRKTFGPETDGNFRGKNPENVKKALLSYVDQNVHDKFEVLYTEICVQIMVGLNRKLIGNLDSIVRSDLRGIYSLETKTSGAAWSYMVDNFTMSLQGISYNHFLTNYYSEEKVFGIVFDVSIFKKIPQHIRIPVQHSAQDFKSFLTEINDIFDRLERDFEELSHSTEKDRTMKCFLRNRENCVQYNRICPYFDICNANNNPLSKLDRIPAGYKIEKWDPRETGHKVKLES